MPYVWTECTSAVFGISGLALNWFSSYMSDRSRRIKLEDSIDTVLFSVQLPFGVPHGSVLGLVLFSRYTTLLSTVIQGHSAPLLCASALWKCLPIAMCSIPWFNFCFFFESSLNPISLTIHHNLLTILLFDDNKKWKLLCLINVIYYLIYEGGWTFYPYGPSS